MKDKERALTDFIEMITKSWTYDRMTEKERTNCIKALRETTLKGTWEHRREVLDSAYNAFLLALDYTPRWREPETNEPVPFY